MKHGKIHIQWRSVLLGTGVGILILVCSCAAAAGMMAKGTVALSHLELFAGGILALAALVGCLTALLGDGMPVDAALTAGGELVVLIALNAGLNGGEMEGILFTILVLAGGCGGALLLSRGHSRQRKARGRRHRNR